MSTLRPRTRSCLDDAPCTHRTRQEMVAKGPTFPRWMKLALLTLGLLGIVVAGWLAFTPPQLRLRTIIEPPTEFQHDNALIQGFSPDGSLLVIEYNRYDSVRLLPFSWGFLKASLLGEMAGIGTYFISERRLPWPV
jgi:hypothetical protein